MKFFSSYAVRACASTSTIDEMFDTYQQAYDYAYNQLCDDDDAGVFALLEPNDKCTINGKEEYLSGFFSITQQLKTNVFEGYSVRYINLYKNQKIILFDCSKNA